jgi:hypothetical protein
MGDGQGEDGVGADHGLVADEGERLVAGWEDEVDGADSLLLAVVRNHAQQARTLAAAGGWPALDVAGAVAACSALPHPFANLALVSAPLLDPAGEEALTALEAFAAEHPGVPFLTYFPYGTPDLTSRGHRPVGHPPLMVRPPGGAAPEGGPDVTITEVDDVDLLATWERTVIDCYPVPELADVGPGATFPPGLLGTGWRFWLATGADGEPLGTSAVFVDDRVQVVEFVSVAESGRGRGVGAALTWAASTAEPELPATLVASDLGRPVYERLGFAALLRITLWVVAGGG